MSSDRDWQELASREPYFAVLTDEKYRNERLTADARREFFATGEADVEQLFALIRERVAPDFAPRSALDFGCGVGRLTAPLTRRVERVFGFDVAPAMLELARVNAPAATFAATLPDVELDLILSLLVFQHIPVDRGLGYLRDLLARLAPGGVAALQFTFRRPGGVLRRLARSLRARLPFREPYMQMNEYDPFVIREMLIAAGCSEPVFLARKYGDIEGALVLIAKP